MKKVNKIVLIDDDEITCWLNKSLLEDMQAAEHVELFHDSDSRQGGMRAYFRLLD